MNIVTGEVQRNRNMIRICDEACWRILFYEDGSVDTAAVSLHSTPLHRIFRAPIAVMEAKKKL
jgi:hypothetical protein